MSQPLAQKQQSIALPDVPVLWATTKKAFILTPDGELQTPPKHKAQQILHKKPVLACHMPYTCKRLGVDDLFGFDVLELFAFVHPGKFCVPTPAGLAKALGLSVPDSQEDYPFTLLECVQALLSDLSVDPWQVKANPLEIAAAMGQQGKGWSWTPFIFSALDKTYDPKEIVISKSALNAWKHLPEWTEEAPALPPSHDPVNETEAQERLTELLGFEAESRQQQMAYTAKMTSAFSPKQDEDKPHTTLLEAGTGTGKTLGYLAPASLWAEKNQGAVWISTYTKNLQRQIEQELDKVYPDPDIKESKTAIRKGRENYMCLLSYEETAAGVTTSRNLNQIIASGIMARWIAATGDGDLSGVSFPGWLAGLLGYQHTVGLADRRGECIYSACDHYHRCFVERAVRKSAHARIVVANHALVMIQTALAGDGENLPQRYIFDEGHHLFESADSAFAGHLTARETRDLRRWILGAEGGKRSRARGLKRRAEDLVTGSPEAEKLLLAVLHYARALTSDGWTSRLKDGKPKGPTEEFILGVYNQVYARTNGRDGPYSLETETYPLNEGLAEQALQLKDALKELQKPMQDLSIWMRKHVNDNADTLDSDTKKRMEAVINALERRGRMTLSAWISMLESLQAEEKKEEFVDWMEIERADGKTIDIGLYRHWIDPMRPFAAAIKPHAHGIAVTSATLRDEAGGEEENWSMALQRSGLDRLNEDTIYDHFSSPFEYEKQTKIFVVTDVNKNDLDQIASAYRELFKASNGSALGLFTAISRLRGVHQRIANTMEDFGIPLYAQHMDEMDTGTLVDIFRDEIQSCLLGTDAIRDGVDIPGESLRLIVFDRVPWPRPTILHKARREAFGKKRYDEMITRLKLKQAYGRLIRRADDKGVYVMLDSGLPSRLHSAFPETVEIERLGLKDVIEGTKNFLNP